jgi:hypothetical protein
MFHIIDWKGRPVSLTEGTYAKHLPVHPEITDYLEEVQETIRDPDVVLQIEGGAIRPCRLGLGKGLFERTWLAAVIYYEHDVGTVATFHFMRSLPEEEVLEHRAAYLGGKRFLRHRGTL